MEPTKFRIQVQIRSVRASKVRRALLMYQMHFAFRIVRALLCYLELFGTTETSKVQLTNRAMFTYLIR